MATINLGSIKFKWQGAYNGATAYTVDDVVSYNGSSYICILASTGNLPTNATYWEQMSSAGTNGTDGTDLGTTLTTQGDIVYRDASGLARLGAGTSGQVLQTNGTGANPSWVDASSGKVLQTARATQSSVLSTTATHSNTLYNGGSMGVSDGIQIASLTMTPLSTTSHIYVSFDGMFGIYNNSFGASGIWVGSNPIGVGYCNCSGADIGNLNVHGFYPTTSLSGSQTIQARFYGARSAGTHYVNANHTGSAFGTTCHLYAIEIED